ncbi:MAG: hypothetical protein Q8O32_00140 [bacterium]|nr:hypothetical protein [bacterium]
MKKIFKYIFSVFSLFGLILPNISSALEINYNQIISDEEATDYRSMTQKEIQSFLEEQNSFLKDYQYSGNNPTPAQVATDPELKYIETRSAAEIIYNAAQEAKISPKFILTILQKEQSLIDDSTPTERNLDFAMGYYCFDGDYCNPMYKGFGKQVRSAALQFQWYMDNIESYDYQPGVPVCIDDYTIDLPCTDKGTQVTPANRVTAALYVYTPHIHGNKLFATLWDRYGFGGATTFPIDVIGAGIIPEGSLVKAKGLADSAVYLISNGEKRAFASMTALVSRYDPGKILEISSEEIEKYTNGDLIAHPNYSVLANASGQRYLIDGLTKRLIVSNEAFRQLGFNSDEVLVVSNEELAYYNEAEVLTEGQASPFAQLMKDDISDQLYYVKDGKKSLIIDNFIIQANFLDMEMKEVTAKTLENLSLASPIKLSDGTLIKTEKDKRVYVISAGLRRFIPDGETFEALGYKWTNIYTVSSKIMNFHSLGEQITR